MLEDLGALDIHSNPIITASEIWPEVDEDISIKFILDGTALNLNNKDTRNWLNLWTLPKIRMFKGDRQLRAPMSLEALRDKAKDQKVMPVPGLPGHQSHQPLGQVHQIPCTHEPCDHWVRASQPTGCICSD